MKLNRYVPQKYTVFQGSLLRVGPTNKFRKYSSFFFLIDLLIYHNFALDADGQTEIHVQD